MSRQSVPLDYLAELKEAPDEETTETIRECFVKRLARHEDRNVSFREGLALYRIATIVNWLAECIPFSVTALGLLKWWEVVGRENWKEETAPDEAKKPNAHDEEFMDILREELEAFLGVCKQAGGEWYRFQSVRYVHAALETLIVMRMKGYAEAGFRLAYILCSLLEMVTHLPLVLAYEKNMKRLRDGHEAMYGISREKKQIALAEYEKLILQGIGEREAQKRAGAKVGRSDRQVRRYLLGQS